VIDKEKEVFTAVATRLREKHPQIYVVGTELTSTPPRFPAVSIVQTNNAIKTEHSTFDSLENVVREDYKAEVFSNLEKGKETETKEITNDISDVFCELGYERTFCEPIANGDPTISRRISRYRKNNVI
jgi:hypothetical protein